MKRTATILLVIVLTLFTVCPCVLAQTVPFHEGFDDGVLPTGWTIIDSDGDGYCWNMTSDPNSAHSGNGMIYSASYHTYAGALTPDNWLISPAITVTQYATLSFWVKEHIGNYQEGENYSIYVATSNNVSAFEATTPVLTGTTTVKWEQKWVDLSLYAGQTIYIAFRHHNTYNRYRLDLDDVEITCCSPVNSLEVNDISGTAAMVTWQNIGSNEPDHYELSYKVEDDSAWTIISPIYTNNYLLTSLSPTAKYQVKFRVFCDDTTSSDYIESTFHTECLDGSSDLIIGMTDENIYGHIFPVGFDYNYSYSQQIYHAYEIGEARSIDAIDLQYFYGTPEIRTVDIYLGHTQQFGFTNNNDWVPISDLTLVYSDSVMFDNSGEDYWIRIPFNTTFEYNGVDNLVLACYDRTGSSIYSWYYRCYTHSTPEKFSKFVGNNEATIDIANIGSYYGNNLSYRNNIRFPGICVSNACEMPLVSAVNITDSSALLIVSSANSADGFELEYRQEGNNSYSTLSAASTSILLTGLRQNTRYEVRTRSLCGSAFSTWKKTTFTTGVGNHNRLYVSSSGTGNGTSWTDAANDLQWALNTAQVIKNTYSTTPEIWVAAGTYYGDTSIISQNAFTMVEGVNVYGGFAGNEPEDFDLTQRNIETNTTVLDGLNMRRVLYQPSLFTTPTLWDGFTIQHGHVPDYMGGGVWLLQNGHLSHSVVKNNSAYQAGGIFAYSAQCIISNCLISNNTADEYGGGIQARDGAIITNSTIVRNAADNGAGFSGISDPQFVNVIVWGNGTNPSNNVSGDLVCSYSAIEGGWDGTGNIALSDFNPPLFVNPSLTSGTADSTENVDWHLQEGSPCINRGDNSAATDSYDLDGTTRIKRDTVDMGCFESDYYSSPLVQPNYSGIVYVTQGGAGTQTGEDWANAIASISNALTIAKISNADVWVAAGTYFGDTTATPENTFTMVEGVNVYGGFAGNEPEDFDLSLRDFETNATILDGQNARRVLYQPESYTLSTLWDGFTIQHGQVDSYSAGGGVLLRRNGCLSHCIVKNNYAGSGGGIYANYSTISNCLVSNNTAANTGGGIHAWYSTITNTTIVRNTSSYEGAGFWGDQETQFMNNIVWGNGTSPSKNVAGDFVCSYSAIEGGWDGTGNIVLYDFNPPHFVNPSSISGISDSTENDDWHLQEGSPCINRGDNSAATDNYDLDGTTRIKRDTVDMGCFESDYYSSPINGPEYTGIVYVTQEGAGAQTGENWANATSSISFALSMAHAYQTDVWVATGTYYGDTSSTSQNAFTMMKGVNVYGGFAGDEPAGFDLSSRNFEANATILDGQNARRVLYQLTSFNTLTTWDGFTIQHGSSSGSGGGAYLQENAKLSNCIIKNNTVANYCNGGGVYAGYNSTVSNCLIVNNTAYYYGYGAGVYAGNNSTISNCLISNNTAKSYGGGMYVNEAVVSNCLISNNTSNQYGGGVYVISDNSTISNSTIVKNTANNGAGVYVDEYDGVENNQLINSIVWGNGSSPSNNIVGNLVCSYSAIEGGYQGLHNIILGEQFNQQPMFVQPTLTSGADDTSVGDWHLQQGSICINHGNNAAVVDSLDLDGNTRIKRDTVDLGCYESDFYSVPLVQPDYSNIIYVMQNGAGNQTGENWANATSSIAGALEIAHTYNADVWVAAGTYYGDTTATSENAFTMVEGVNVYGGFAGNEPEDFDLSLRDFETNATILDGQNARRVLYQPSSFNTETTWDGFTIQHGSSNNGGGAYLDSNGKLSHCAVKHNTSFNGGGVYAYYSTITNCLIENNTSNYNGGGLYSSHSTISNSLVSNNTAIKTDDFIIQNGDYSCGGGIFVDGWYGNSTIVNTTIVRNDADKGAGIGSWTWMGIGGNLTNCIVWGNGNNASDNISDNTVTCSFSAIGGGYTGENNITLSDANPPLFVNPSLTSGASDSTANVDWHLQDGSPCINRGDNASVIDSLDLNNSARIKRDTVDIGCYESNYYSSPINEPEYAGVVYVTEEGAGTQTGEDWTNATSSISNAIAIARTYHADVWVAAGTYYGDTATNSKNSFTMVDSVNVYGGFAGHEPVDYDLSLRDFETNATILDGQNTRRVLYRPRWLNTSTTWDGFTIQNGLSENYGGGILLRGNGKLSHCVIRNNTANDGGGVCLYGTASVTKCLISNNTANDNGGGVIAMFNSTISNCQISSNTAGDDGGGLCLNRVAVSNCLISNNTANDNGGGVIAYGNSIITNSTIVRNADLDHITDGVCSVYGYDTVINCIIWGNGNNASDNISGNVTCTYSAIEGGYNGDNNIALSDVNPPLFVNPSITAGASDNTENVDWHLQEGSPCINVGNNAFVTESFDLDGTVRIKNDIVDLGCYESDYGGSTPCTDVVSEFWHSACDSYTWNNQIYTQSGDYEQAFALENGCDSVVTLHLTITNTDHTDFTDVACDSYTWNGETYTESGTYSQTFTNSAGCDSIVTLYLTVNNATTGIDEQTACESFTWINGVTYTESTNTPTFTLTNAAGCDSIVTLHLTINNPVHTAVSETACESFTWNGTEYTVSGDYTYSHTDTKGCTQVDTLHLTINNPVHTAVTETSCESFTWNGTTYTVSGDYTYSHADANGCTQVDTLHLTIHNPVHTAVTETACESFTWNGTTYTVSGEYTYSHADANGCTQVDTLHLTINNPVHTSVTETSCESFTWNGETYMVSGDYMFSHADANGCTQVDTLHLTINNPVHTAVSETACESFTWNGTEYTVSGDYTYSHADANGCTQVDTLHLTIYNPVHTAVTEVACESFTWNGSTYTQTGDYPMTLTAANGCDSIVTLHLTIKSAQFVQFADTACENFTWNDITYAQSGDYTQTFSAASGCDSVVTLHLTITNTDHTNFTDEACDSYTWNGETYTQSGDYTQTFTNSAGCDSVVTLHLTINNPAHTAVTETACESFTWNGTTYTASGDYTYSHTDANGCTQVDTLHLTIHFAQSAEFAVATTDSCYTWNSQTYCASGDYTQTLQTVQGCDSVVTLHLTITVGIDNYDGFEFKVYPNPTSNIVNVECIMHDEEWGEVELHLCDAYGRLVDVVRANNDSPLQTAQIDLSQYANGIYFVKAVADEKVIAVRKVVKQ